MSQKPGPNIGPKGDVSYVRATSAQVHNLPMAPSPVHSRDGNQTPVVPPPPSNIENDWDDREEIRLRELEEARARAAQMEKTMRWWSDCTANWREKWSKVRNERNKAREENRQLRSKLDAIIKECNALKREKEELFVENGKLKQVLTSVKGDKVVSPVSTSGNSSPAKQINKDKADGNQMSPAKGDNSGTNHLSKPVEDSVKQELDKIVEEKNRTQCVEKSGVKSPPRTYDELSPYEESEGSLSEDRVVLMELKLDESQKTILAERDEKIALMKSNEKLQHEVNALKVKVEEVKRSKQEALMELEQRMESAVTVAKLKDQQKHEMSRISQELEDESVSRNSMDKRLGELRRELERLQRENADEWGKRERLETEKFALERENKKLRIQMEDIQEQLDKKSQHATTVVDSDMKSLQYELAEKNKELSDLRHAHTKMKKTLQEKTTELEHCKRRAEQYELEVKKLRTRIEELKKDLATAEDEVDSQGNTARKLQRTNDELQEQVESLQVQLDHLQSRLRHSSQTASAIGGRSSRVYNPDLPDSADADDDDSDDFDEQS